MYMFWLYETSLPFTKNRGPQAREIATGSPPTFQPTTVQISTRTTLADDPILDVPDYTQSKPRRSQRSFPRSEIYSTRANEDGKPIRKMHHRAQGQSSQHCRRHYSSQVQDRPPSHTKISVCINQNKPDKFSPDLVPTKVQMRKPVVGFEACRNGHTACQPTRHSCSCPSSRLFKNAATAGEHSNGACPCLRQRTRFFVW